MRLNLRPRTTLTRSFVLTIRYASYLTQDPLYRDLGKKAIELWRSHPLYAPYFHEVGIFFRSGRPSSVDAPWIKTCVKNAKEPVGNAYSTEYALSKRPTARTIATVEESLHVFPASLRPHLGPAYTSFGNQKQVGYFNPQAGWANAREATFAVLDEAQRLGATICSGVTIVKFLYAQTDGKPRVCGAVASDGRVFHADQVILAAGSWTPSLLDQCQLPLPQGLLKPSAHCVLALRIQPSVAQLFSGTPVLFDMNTGMYAFEPNADGILKCAIHGVRAPCSHTDGIELARARECHEHISIRGAASPRSCHDARAPENVSAAAPGRPGQPGPNPFYTHLLVLRHSRRELPH